MTSTITSWAYKYLVLDIASWDNKSVILYRSNGQPNQQWVFTQVEPQVYTITSQSTPLGLQVSAGNSVIVSSTPSKWTIRDDGTYAFTNQLRICLEGTDLALTAPNGYAQTPLQVSPDDGSPSQVWSYDGSFQ